MNRSTLITLALCALCALPFTAACNEDGAYPWEKSVRTAAGPAVVAVLPFVGRMDTEIMIERAVARFFTVHQAAVKPGVTYIRLPRVAEPSYFPESAISPEDLRDLENRIFFEESKARLYDLLGRTGHDYALYVQADTGSEASQYLLSVFDLRARENCSESRSGTDSRAGLGEQEIVRAIEFCFSRLAKN